MSDAQVEGLADLLNAETEQQRRQAFDQMEGSLHDIYVKWSQDLLRLVAQCEACVDFGDSGDVGDDEVEDLRIVRQKVTCLVENVEGHLRSAVAGERLRNGVRVAIVGRPNVGKSSLLNVLLRRPAAIVSNMAGTTRDAIETHLDVGGYPVILTDTAGLRLGSEDMVELEGMKRTIDVAQVADVVIFVINPEDLLDLSRAPEEASNQLINSYRSLSSSISGTEESSASYLAPRLVFVCNKIDLIQGEQDYLNQSLSKLGRVCCFVSCKTGAGLEEFFNSLSLQVASACSCDQVGGSSGSMPPLTRARHRHHLKNAAKHLRAYLDDTDPLLSTQAPLVVQAHHLSLALKELGLLSGQITSSSVLDKIFQDFCIGK